MAKILRGFKQAEKPEDKEKRMLAIERDANEELSKLVADFQQKHNVLVVPSTILSFDAIRGPRVVKGNIECVTNLRFK